jgi:3-deoxy-manno-octulosonate cytidylyltransferase (CMP-KDO synthetase)
MSRPLQAAKGVVAIPARLAATRLPNKLLLAETGRPLLAHVVENCLKAVEASEGLLGEVVVGVDDPALHQIAVEAGAKAVDTGDGHICGTSRIAEAVEKLELGESLDFVVNVQGDEPELAPQAIVQAARTLLDNPWADIATLVVAMPPGTEAQKADPSAVKAVLDGRGRALYFTRAPAPFDRNPVAEGRPAWFHHLGIYAYRREALEEFARTPPSPLEIQEGLEQLRAMEAGRVIAASTVPAQWAGKGIDTPADYAAFVRRRAA